MNGNSVSPVTEEDIEELKELLHRLANRLEAALAEGDNPVSMKCQLVLDSVPKCYDFSVTRRYAACRAWQMMEEEKISWREAISKAWSELKEKCTWD
jgi:hypothetical protein